MDVLEELFIHGDIETGAGEQAFDPVDMCGAFADELRTLAVALAAVLVVGRGDVHEGPEFPSDVTLINNYIQQIIDVDAIALGPSETAVLFDAAGIDDGA
jgi:hypothetical protein